MKHMPEGWRWVRLEDVFQRIQRTIKTDVENVLSITARVGFVDQAEKFGRVIAGKNLERYILLRHGEFAYNKGNSNSYPQGCIYMLEEFEQGAVPNVYYCFRATSSEVCTEFYKFYFESGALNSQLRRLINSGVRNDGLLNLPADHFFRVRIPLPPIDEQRRIAEVLRDADANIVDIEDAIAAAEQIRKGFLERFICELEQVPPTRLNKALIRIKREVEIDLKQLYYQIGIRSHGKGIFHKEPFTGQELGNKRIYWVEPGDFVLNIVFAWEGAVALVSENERGMCGSHRFPTFEFNTDICLPEFLLFYFKTPTGVRQLEDVSPGGAGRNKTLNQGDFLKLKISLPDLEVQQEIVVSLQTHTDAILTMQAEAASLREVKRGLMQGLLSGQVRT